jgi:hypothetical protein
MSNQIDRKALSQKWIHSHEEDTADEIVFRPESYKFPPSRGRRSFQLAADGTMVEYGIGPDDRPNPTPGLWELNDANELELRTGGADVRKTVMRLICASLDKLVVKKN